MIESGPEALLSMGMAQSQPSIRLVGLEPDGIYLLPPDDPAFLQALDPERRREGDVLLPYAAFIKNATRKTVIAWSVRWDSIDSEGKAVPQRMVLWNFHTHKPEHGIPSHTGRLISAINGLGTRYSPSDDSYIKEVHEMVSFYRRQIGVDAVLFEDGAAAGPDLGGSIPRLKARLDADRDVAAEVMKQNVSVETLMTTLGNLREAAFSRLTGGRERHYGSLLLQTNAAQSYEEAYVLMKGYFAAQALDSIEAKGGEKGLQALRKFLAERRIPKTR
jgi:hypothetical protein